MNMDRRSFLKIAVAAGFSARHSCVDQNRKRGNRMERWIRPENSHSLPIWGLRDAIQVGLWPASLEGAGDGGPRGLLRIGYPILEGGKKTGLVNFIAVEPIVK